MSSGGEWASKVGKEMRTLEEGIQEEESPEF